MRNPFKQHAHGSTIQTPPVSDTPAGLLNAGMPAAMPDPGLLHVPERTGVPSRTDAAHAWNHMRPDVDPDCARDPGSDLAADGKLEKAAAEEAVEERQGEEEPRGMDEPRRST